MSNNYCIFCKHCDKASANADKEMDCKLLNIKVTALRCCPGWKPIEYTPEEQARIDAKREQLLALSNNNSVQTQSVKSTVNPKISKPVKTEVEVETDYAEEEKQVKLFEHQKLARNKFKNLDEIALFFEMGCGKGQPISSNILTPTGFKKLGDINLGDLVISPVEGKAYPVTGIYNKGVRHINKVTFTNGTFTYCDDEHLWNIQSPSSRTRGAGFKTVDMSYIKSHDIKKDYGHGVQHKMYVPINTPISFDSSFTDANSYALGILLGDGSLHNKSVSVCIPECDVKERFAQCMYSMGYTLNQVDDITYRPVINTAKISLYQWARDLGINATAEHKFIPAQYLYADITTRKNLLEGLIDSDGFVQGNLFEYSSASEQLIDDITFLVSSLGGVVTRYKDHQDMCNDELKKMSYRISFMLPEGFNVSKKHTAKLGGQGSVYKAIDSIEDAGSTDCVCIYIDSPDHLYITDNWIVTHNTVTSLSIMIDKYKAGKIDSLLIVAPNDVHKQWFDDLCNEDALLSKILEQEHVPCIGQIIGGRGGQKQFYDFEDDGKLHIVCVNIDTFSQPHKWEVIVDWVNKNKTAIIIDEATSIKNPNSKRSQRMLYEFNDVMKKRNTVLFSGKKPNTSVRCVLTGTPVSNGPMDLWSIMEFIKPNYFGRNYYSFMNYYGMHTKLKLDTGQQISVLLTEKTWQGIKGCKDYSEAFNTFGCSEDTYMTVMHQDHYIGPYKHADELKQLLEPVAVFAKLTDCVDMPPVHYITKEVPLSDAQKACYNDMKHDLLATYDDNVATAKNKLVVTLRLQQIASGFIMGHKEINPEDLELPCWSDVEAADEYDVTPDEVIWLGDTNPKLEQLKRDVAELDKPLLILTRFSAEAAKIYDILKDDYNCMLFTGWKTTGSIEKFKAGEFQIMVANTTKIARGFNLQVAHTTIYYSNTFSMELRQQSEFRTFRMGQKYPCTYIDYVSCEVDKTIADALRLKKGLLEYIRDKNIEEVV